MPTEAITQERLAGWAKRLREAQATPMVLVGVGHDETAGQIVVIAVEDLSDELVAAFLRYAYRTLTGRDP